MDKWEFERLLSEETKVNILNEVAIWLREEKEIQTDEEVNKYINVSLGNSYWEMIKSIIDNKEVC